MPWPWSRRRSAFFLIVIVTAVAFPAADGSATPGPKAPTNGVILFERPIDRYPTYWTMQPDGTGATQILGLPLGGIGSPNYSADGTVIAYVTRSGVPEGGYDIYTMNADGTGQTKVTDLHRSLYGLDWSPDGSRFLFSSGGGGGTVALYSVAADGSDLVKITQKGINFNGAWSPDGTRIAYVNTSGKGHRIFTVAPDGTGRELVDSHNEFNPEWSPDGSTIVVVGPRGTLFTIHPDGTGRTEIPGTHNMRDAVYSPDGTRFLTTKIRGLRHPHNSIWTLNTDGTEPIRLVKDASAEAWQPT